MVRSSAISWKIGLAVAALALPLGQLRAQADDGLSETLEIPPNSLEPKEVRVILLPPASDDVFVSRRPELLKEAPIIMVQPAGKHAVVELLSKPVEINEDATIVASPSVPEQPLRAEIQDDATVEESPPPPEQPPRVALLPPVSDAGIVSSPPIPEKTQKSVTPIVSPSLPVRSPFRQSPFKSEVVENTPKNVVSSQQQASKPAPAKGNAATRLLAKLWPGNKEESTPDTSTAEADSPVPPTALASTSIEQAEAGSKSEKPPIKRFLDGIQFWKH